MNEVDLKKTAGQKAKLSKHTTKKLASLAKGIEGIDEIQVLVFIQMKNKPLFFSPYI